MDRNGSPECECPDGYVLNPDGVSCDRSSGKSKGIQKWSISIKNLIVNSYSYLLPPAYIVRREGTVFTGVCLSTGGGSGYPPRGGVPDRVPPQGGVWVPPGGT